MPNRKRSMNDHRIAVWRGDDHEQAEAICEMLASHDIEANLAPAEMVPGIENGQQSNQAAAESQHAAEAEDDSDADSDANDSHSEEESWVVLVDAEAASYARRHVERAAEPTSVEHDVDDDDIIDDRDWRKWPKCEECGTRRMTQCSFCNSTNSEFPLADGTPASSEDATVLLCCHLCDEPFEPEFYRYCPECGFDAGDGLDARYDADPDLANPRVHMILGILIALGVGSMAYYFFVLS